MIVTLIFGVLMFGAGFIVGSGFVLMLLRDAQEERERPSDAPVVQEIEA